MKNQNLSRYELNTRYMDPSTEYYYNCSGLGALDSLIDFFSWLFKK